MQILSIVQWYHFAYMVISVALLGFGASGTIISLARSWLMKRAEFMLPLLMISSGIVMAVVIEVSQTDFLRFDSYLVFVERAHVGALVLTYLVLFVPFFLGALALGLVFVRYVGQIGRLYFSNLVGSGLGGVVAIVLLWVFLPQKLSSLISLLPFAAGLLFLPDRSRLPIVMTAIIGCSLSVYYFIDSPRLIPSEYKSLSRALNLPQAKIVLERSSPYGLVQIVSSPALRYAPGLSLAYRQPLRAQEAVFNNGDWYGPIVAWSRTDSVQLLDYTTLALPYTLGVRNRVLVMQAGTGSQVAQAITNGAHYVTAVEPHTTVLSILEHDFAQATDSLFYHPAVTVDNLDPRTYLMSDTSTYDLIVLPTLDAFGGTAGLYALQEQYTLTKQAFHAMWKRLTPDGVISVSSWMDYPVRNPLKALATLVEVLSEEGVENVAEHIAAVRSWGTITFIAKRTPLTKAEIENVRKFCRRMLFDPALLPQLDPAERTHFNQLSDESIFEYLDEVMSSHRAALYADYDFNIRPATDDRPYFSQFLRWESLPYLEKLFGQQALPFLEVGYLIVGVTFVQIFVVAVCLIILPLFRMEKHRGGRSWTLVYFGALGVGYMFVEIVFIQRFILYFGHPIYAAAAVIAAMLICSGIGSYFSSRFRTSPTVLWRIVSLAGAFIVVYSIVLTPLLYSSISLQLTTKVALTVLLIAPSAFVMGMPFPLGLRFLSERNEAQIPWAWGINGCMSVVSTALATLLAVEIGFLIVMICAAGMYAGAAVVTAFER
jgi:spermidine synthase